MNGLTASGTPAPMDTLTVTVFRVPDLTGDYGVDLMGQISMPLVGDAPTKF